MDPDASSGSQGYGPGVDVWAVGILAYELLLGGPPFEAETKQETLRRILTDQPFLPRHWSRSCRDFLTEVNCHAHLTGKMTACLLIAGLAVKGTVSAHQLLILRPVQ